MASPAPRDSRTWKAAQAPVLEFSSKMENRPKPMTTSEKPNARFIAAEFGEQQAADDGRGYHGEDSREEHNARGTWRLIEHPLKVNRQKVEGPHSDNAKDEGDSEDTGRDLVLKDMEGLRLRDQAGPFEHDEGRSATMLTMRGTSTCHEGHSYSIPAQLSAISTEHEAPTKTTLPSQSRFPYWSPDHWPCHS